jgi:hypothetical protein
MGNIEGLSNLESSIIGFINISNSKDYDLGFLLSGSPDNPHAVKIVAGAQAVSLNNIPNANTVYSFVYSGN